MIGQRRFDRAVNGSVEMDPGFEAQRRNCLAGECQHHYTQALLTALMGLQRKDGAADVANGVVQVVDGLLDSIRYLGVRGQTREALQRHTGGEEALDHRVVQVSSDSLSIFKHGKSTNTVVQTGILDGDTGCMS